MTSKLAGSPGAEVRRAMDATGDPVCAESASAAVSARTSVTVPWRKLQSGGARATPALAAHLDGATDQAAVALLEATGDGEGALEAELFGIARIDAGDEWAGEIGEEILAEFAPHEVGNGLVAFGRMRAAERLTDEAEFGAPADEGRADQARGAERGGDQAAAQQNVTRGARVGAKEFAAES